MRRGSATRAAGAALLLACVTLLTGCLPLHQDDIELAAREALDDAGLEAGAEAFAKQPPGMGDRYDILLCTVVPASAPLDAAAADAVADALNAVRHVADDFARWVDAVHVRAVTSADSADLDDFCRLSPDAVVFDDVGFRLSEGEFLDPFVYGVDVPYDDVVVLSPEPRG